MNTRILYIEDNPLNMRLVRKILKAAGFEMIEAMDGKTGIEMAFSQEPDLILMDINLPDIDGIAATGKIKSSAHLSDIPIIALTANSMHGDRERFIAAGCDDYIPKPVTKNELVMAIRRNLSTAHHYATA